MFGQRNPAGPSCPCITGNQADQGYPPVLHPGGGIQLARNSFSSKYPPPAFNDTRVSLHNWVICDVEALNSRIVISAVSRLKLHSFVRARLT